ncbi:MAG: DUF167 domain-containing protein [Hydrogenophilaceae bacterium]|jgi:hypothetical protein|nr:DUF167 domain-containing protein [Hydrogenophilaceae bacterium]
MLSAAGGATPVTATPTGAALRVRLTPRAAQDRIDAIGADADGAPILLARVRAAPDKGAANDALERLIARAFAMPRSQVAVIRGASARIKLVAIEGAAPGALRARLAALTEQA